MLSVLSFLLFFPIHSDHNIFEIQFKFLSINLTCQESNKKLIFFIKKNKSNKPYKQHK